MKKDGKLANKSNDPLQRIHPIKPFLPTELEDYDLEWDKNWPQRVEKVRGTTAERPLDILALYWKYAWNTARCPWLIPVFVEANNSKIKREKFWELMIENSETQLTVIGTQVVAYTGIYFAYENFVTNCIESKAKREFPNLMGYKPIKNKLIEVFDSQVESKTWSHPSITKIRYVRNDLAHNGGVPSSVSHQHAGDMIIGGHIAVTPNDIKEELEDLLMAVDVLVNVPFPTL